MTTEQLIKEIESRYSSRRDFIAAFNAKVGKVAIKDKETELLDETRLSHQLNGRVSLSGFAQAAYTLFFNSVKPKS